MMVAAIVEVHGAHPLTYARRVLERQVVARAIGRDRIRPREGMEKLSVWMREILEVQP